MNAYQKAASELYHASLLDADAYQAAAAKFAHASLLV